MKANANNSKVLSQIEANNTILVKLGFNKVTGKSRTTLETQIKALKKLGFSYDEDPCEDYDGGVRG